MKFDARKIEIPMVIKMKKSINRIVVVMCIITTPVWADNDEMKSHEHMKHDMNMTDDMSKNGADEKSNETSDMKPMNHEMQGGMQAMDHSEHAMKKNNMGDMKGMDHNSMSMDSMKSDQMDMGSAQGGSAPANARDPHAFSDGYDFGELAKPRLADEHNFSSLLVDRLEAVSTSDNKSAIYDLQFWYGRDYDRLVIKSEGDYDNQSLEESSTELLWSHALGAYWNTQLGIRYDSAENKDQSWLGFGIQGLAPYWFELDISAYIGEQGRSALNMEAEYEILITQKWVLQPRVEMALNIKDDEAAGIGSGLSETVTGIRLRYEIRREFAPYVGFEWAKKYGATADYANAANSDTSFTRAVAGVRFWF